jgi:hypothetical protein
LRALKNNIAEGIELGKKEGQISTLIDLVRKKKLSIIDAADELNITPEKFRSMVL